MQQGEYYSCPLLSSSSFLLLFAFSPSLCCSNSDDTGIIYRAHTDGTSPKAYITNLGVPNGLAVDYSSGKLYFTDLSRGSIYRTDVSGGGDNGEVEELISGMAKPFHLAVSWEGSRDSGGPHLYWSDPTQGRLYRSDLNGSNVITMGMIEHTYHQIYEFVKLSFCLLLHMFFSWRRAWH